MLVGGTSGYDLLHFTHISPHVKLSFKVEAMAAFFSAQILAFKC